MPATSKAQYRFMQAMLAGDKPKKGKKAPSKEVAREFTEGVKPSKLPERKKKSKY